MIEKTDFPYTLGGYVEQQNYKGFDIAVSIRRYKGISAYVISSEKRLIREESATFADKEDMFRFLLNLKSPGSIPSVPMTDIWNSKNVEKKKIRSNGQTIIRRKLVWQH